MSTKPSLANGASRWLFVCLISALFTLPVSAQTQAQLAALRLKPTEATGGTNLYSRNFGWGTSLVSLPGRAGLDAGFGISSNSLVWIKDSATSKMIYDPDLSNAGPGFKFGFPTIEPPFTDSATNGYAFLMVDASGGRTIFRRVGTTTEFVPGDSSYRKLVINSGDYLRREPHEIDIKLTHTNGTQYHYVWNNSAYRLYEIKDRNGNYISMAYDSYGKLTTMTDTLERVVMVNYNSSGLPESITQTWKDTNGSGTNTTHTWATLNYVDKTVAHNFGSLTVAGPANSTTVKVLDKIAYADGSSTRFDYNGYLQVQKISNHAPDSTTQTPHILNYVSTNLDSVSGTQSDVPRLSQTRTKAENFNSGNEVAVDNSILTGQTVTDIDANNVTATRIQVMMQNHPNGNATNTFVYESGWKEGMAFRVDDWHNNPGWTWGRSVLTRFTQDDTSASYIKNPRVTETKVTDGTNTKRTTIDYWETSGVAIYGLVKNTYVYDTDQTTVLKLSYAEYNMGSAYTSRHIIGLPSHIVTYGLEGTSLVLTSKTVLTYDEGNFNDSTLQQNITATAHDLTNYPSTFTTGRGNLTSTTRCDALTSTLTACNGGATSSTKYNVTGNVVSKTDPLSRVTKVFYADDWNGGTYSATYAYPTTVTDPGGYSSTIEYRYDIGANVWASSPTPSGSGNTNGKTTTRTFSDTDGRLTKEKIENSGAYTRYSYATTGNATTSYSTIIDVNGDSTINTSDEVATETLFDGAGRVWKTRTANPGSSGGYSGKVVEYDILGRAKRGTVPTEINSSWNPAGDDYRGMSGSNYIWLWNTKEFDWMGRVTRIIPSDSTGSDGKDTLIEYAGCGCAGGLVTTTKGPITTAIDVAGNTQTTKRRWQKSYADILGRAYKSEIWDLDGAGSAPYSTVKTFLNGRDQATTVRQYSGGDTSSTYQDTVMTYDGHGRLATKRLPEYDSGATMDWTYNADDSIATVTDPRDAVTTYTYGLPSTTEKRAVVTAIAYSVPSGSGITDPTDVSFTYDAAGNRTYMSDGTGTLTYTYDELSRLKTETKDFTDTLANAPSGGVYTLTYDYHIAGALKSMDGPFANDAAFYTLDATGRTTAIGSGSTATTAYASSIAYRAFGSVKSFSLSTTTATNVTATYDDALRPATYEAESAANSTDIHNAVYAYNNDGTLSFLDNNRDGKFDQTSTYDFAGRLRENKTGNTTDGYTYQQTLSYDAFSNMASRNTKAYSFSWNTFSASYANNRKTSGGAPTTYDAAGNAVSAIPGANGHSYWAFDASGRQWRWEDRDPSWQGSKTAAETTFDGDGRSARVADLYSQYTTGVGWSAWTATNKYSIHSSVTGQSITSVASDGSMEKTHIYFGSTEIAIKETGGTRFRLTDPLTGSTRDVFTSGQMSSDDDDEMRNELAGMGVSVPPVEPDPILPPPNYKAGGSAAGSEMGCSFNGGPISCNSAIRITEKFGLYTEYGGIMQINIFWGHWEWDSEGYTTIRRQNAGEPHRRTEGGKIIFLNDPIVYQISVSWITVPKLSDGKPKRRLSTEELGTMRDDLAKLADDKTCGEFMKKVLAQFESKTINGKRFDPQNKSIKELFEWINTSGGFWSEERTNGVASYGAGTISFDPDYFSLSEGEMMRFGFDKKGVYSEIGNRISGEGYDVYEISRRHKTALMLVHELVHAAYDSQVNATHSQMEDAAEIALEELGIGGPMPKKTGDGSYFDAALLKACGRVKL